VSNYELVTTTVSVSQYIDSSHRPILKSYSVRAHGAEAQRHTRVSCEPLDRARDHPAAQRQRKGSALPRGAAPHRGVSVTRGQRVVPGLG
jgi:hypothetical protein